MQSDTPCPNRDDSNKASKGKLNDTQKPKSNRCGIYVSELDRKLLTELLDNMIGVTCAVIYCDT